MISWSTNAIAPNTIMLTLAMCMGPYSILPHILTSWYLPHWTRSHSFFDPYIPFSLLFGQPFFLPVSTDRVLGVAQFLSKSLILQLTISFLMPHEFLLLVASVDLNIFPLFNNLRLNLIGKFVGSKHRLPEYPRSFLMAVKLAWISAQVTLAGRGGWLNMLGGGVGGPRADAAAGGILI